MLDTSVFDVDKELVMGILSDVPKLSAEEVIRYKKRGRLFLASLKGRQY